MIFIAGVRCYCSDFIIQWLKCFDLSFLILDPVLSKMKSLARKHHEAALQSSVTANEPYQVTELKLLQNLLSRGLQSVIQHKVNFRKLCFQKTPAGYKATLVSPNFCTQGSGRQLEGFLIFLSYY